MARTNIGVPIKLLHEAENHMVTVEMKNGETYRGLLEEGEDTMNCKLSEVVMKARDGRVTRLEHVFLRGSQIKYIVLPDILRNSDVFKKIAKMRPAGASAGRGGGRGGKTKARK